MAQTDSEAKKWKAGIDGVEVYTERVLVKQGLISDFGHTQTHVSYEQALGMAGGCGRFQIVLVILLAMIRN